MSPVVCLINGNASPLAIRVSVLCTICTEGRHEWGHHSTCPCVVAENGLTDFDEIWHAGFCSSLTQTRTPFK